MSLTVLDCFVHTYLFLHVSLYMRINDIAQSITNDMAVDRYTDKTFIISLSLTLNAT